MLVVVVAVVGVVVVAVVVFVLVLVSFAVFSQSPAQAVNKPSLHQTAPI